MSYNASLMQLFLEVSACTHNVLLPLSNLSYFGYF
jgi:hypothetical protein